MIPMPRMLLPAGRLAALAIAALAITALAITAPAGAQPNERKPVQRVPEVKGQPLAWPRLDAGAVLCRSEADLNRLGQRRSGETVDGPVDCQRIRAPTAVSIVQRKGSGRTEVKLNNTQPTESGWTDAWLPEKAPSGATAAR